MNGPTLADVGLLIPELILVGTALVLMLAARRIQAGPVAVIGTLVAALAAALAAGLAISSGTQTGFDGMLVVDGYSQFFKILVAVALAMTTLLSAGRGAGEQSPRAEYHVLLLLASPTMRPWFNAWTSSSNSSTSVPASTDWVCLSL